ncbi:hypothetical protein J6590_060289 [Homalodisca vitripennis]|nr:hypothetical protein J6590_093324 [Homalodisca vitripennis]KAG8296286.1 hypothetical protein J6590_060289 [Homalodisca vitripennis]
MWMITRAWSKVTETTIFNCFKKSGFTVTTQEDNSHQPPTQEIDTAEGWQTVKVALELEKDAEFEDFVTFDDDVAVCGELTGADIISSVTSVLDENVNADDDDEPDCVISDPNSKEAREAIGCGKTNSAVVMGFYIRCGGGRSRGGGSLHSVTHPVFSRSNGLERRASRGTATLPFTRFLKVAVLTSRLNERSECTLTFRVMIPFHIAMLLQVGFVRWKKLVQHKGLKVWEDRKQRELPKTSQ